MIIHKLIAQHLKHHDDPGFYLLQAQDAISWLEREGVQVNTRLRVLDLGAGHGIFGSVLAERGCTVTFADETNFLMDSLRNADFRKINIDSDDLKVLGKYDLIICSNVLEHLSKPEKFLSQLHELLCPDGYFFLSWTNWLSPWGGHEFSPFHYFGARLGVRLYDKVIGKKRIHTPFKDLFPTYIGALIREMKRNKHLAIKSISPRYYPEFGFITRIPLLREFLTWNCAVLLQRIR
jgi:2-polyprenyl-3-methyl-5-hydroxy-6-metoxy-1,4-benzoquinol methylase